MRQREWRIRRGGRRGKRQGKRGEMGERPSATC